MPSPRQEAPADSRELEQIVRGASASRTPIEVRGGGSKRDIGYPDRDTVVVSTERFGGVIDYDPAELVLTVGAGMRLAEIEALLLSNRQMLAFEPCDFDGAGTSTIGGIIGAGLAGSRRVSAGNVRDHVLGFSAVSGRGEAFVAGGRVVKNVTGYDLSKLMCGSWGSLAVLTQVSLKVLPLPRTSLTLEILGLDDTQGIAAMTRALRSQAAVAAAAYVPAFAAQGSSTLLRLEGFGPSVQARARSLSDVLDQMTLQPLSVDQAAEKWSALRMGSLLQVTDTEVLWRVNVPATAAAGLCSSIRSLRGRFCADWGGHLLFVCLPAGLSADRMRSLVEKAGGHAMIQRAPRDYRALAPALHPERPGVAELALRVKAGFDPANILDPHRFTERLA